MIQHILEWGAIQVTSFISSSGEFGVFLLMALESANIPIPSEIIMPFSGYVASVGGIGFWAIVLAGAFGNLVGSLASYWVGARGGRPFLEKYGKYVLIHDSEIEWGDRAFAKYGTPIAFWSRLLPVVRTFISLPAGINRAPLKSFIIYTFLGSFIWSWFLAFVGFRLGESWEQIRPIFEQFSTVIGGLIILTIVIYVLRHVKDRKDKKHNLSS